ncbi:MAG: hypothetical protein WA208_21555 [Thermoanaerobaculia bacterium]
MTDVEFLDCSEIRMGSPFNVCRLQLQLGWSPDLPNDDWQDLAAESPDGRFIALVRWEVRSNDPGFIIFTLDNVEQRVDRSERHAGCCERIWWSGNSFEWSAGGRS